jgi:type VI secretion system secreted protein VgrG
MDVAKMLSKGPITFTPPAKGKSLIFKSMIAHEELGRLFTYELELTSSDPHLKAEDMLGQLMTVHIELGHGDTRHYNGYVTQFSLAGTSGNYSAYRATLRPWLWLLTRTANCRIFQKMTVPAIIKQVFRDHGLTDFEEKLSGSYKAREFCVQYRETDFNFVSRLMEHEGIYYFFKHSASKHSLVLGDSHSAHEPSHSCPSLPYFPPDEHRSMTIEYVDHWHLSRQLKTGTFVSTDYDFERPQANLLAKLSSPNHHAKADFEVYDYPGDYALTKNGSDYVKIRLEELNSDYSRAEGGTNARGLTVGALLKLTEHPVEDLNKEYLVVSARHVLKTHDPETGSALEEDEVYRSTFTAMESSRPFRSARLAEKPVVHGPQTALVVGKAGEEIWTDNYGRIKVKFHWDRASKSDENSSCWVRVAQVWAGTQWGAMHIPRIGQEVIVDFLEGDPDSPIITGRVYNADNMPPYALPANQTQSGLISRSTKGANAANFNEIRFEDKKGSELLTIHAEKDETIEVEHDESINIGHDRTEEVGHDETVHIKHDRTVTVDNDETVTISGARSETVTKDETISISGSRTESVDKDESITITGKRSESVGKDETIEISGKRTESVGKDETITITGSRKEDVGKDETISITGKRTQTVGKDEILQVGKKMLFDVADEITLKTGDATITMKKNGDITIKGKNLTLDGSGKINVKASGDVIIKGSKVTQN